MADILRRILPEKVCFCIPFGIGIKTLLGLVIVIRLIAMMIGFMYGPFIYIVLPLGGLYVASDLLLLYAVIVSERGILKNDCERRNEDFNEDSVKEDCTFPSLKLWIISWLIMNIIAIIGLAMAIGLFGNLGIWAMTHDPTHMVLFVFIIVLTALLICGEFFVASFYVMVKDAWLVGIIGNLNDLTKAGLTHGGKRVSV